MRRAGFYKTDWFIALLVGLAFVAAVGSGLPRLQKLELLAYDTGVKLTPRAPDAAENIAIIAIDDSSIAQTGRWPWPRSVLADMIERLSHAKAVALLVVFSEPQTDPGLDYIRRIRERYAPRRGAPGEAGELRAFLDQAEKELDTDAALARAIQKSRRLYLPMFFQIGKPAGRPEAALPEFVQRHRFSRIIARPDTPATPVRAQRVAYPLAALGEQAAGIGHLNFTTGSDGGVRAAALAIEYDGEFYPSLPLLLAARGLNL